MDKIEYTLIFQHLIKTSNSHFYFPIPIVLELFDWIFAKVS
jgi:hypothetical protein